MPADRADAITGCLLGTALGDALGLPFENLSPRRQRRFDAGPLRHRFLFGRGMVSDDTEHACMTAQALLVSAGEPDRFTRELAWRLRGWLAGLPAGIGLATLRSILKLWVGFPPTRSGVFSAGNGPCMRAPLLGVCHGDDPDRLAALIRHSTRITHTDPKAEYGALAVALAAHVAASAGAGDDLAARFRARLAAQVPEEGGAFLALSDRALTSAARGEETAAFAQALGLGRGVTGYVYHTVPVVLHAWLRHPRDFRAAVTAVVRCGGDADTTGAIVGGIAGAGVGRAGLPADWLAGLREWPATVGWMETLAARLAAASATGLPQPPVPLTVLGRVARNAFFAAVVLALGFRRLLPPY
jgi:ADP-ribosylglycohydrolase